ncbi:hypothetical protein HGA88_01185 [Candidatus Roizmanbacteria bacterium]|nr:hypothetical protein [Candidatus Roizmanbacteria bacterium]
MDKKKVLLYFLSIIFFFVFFVFFPISFVNAQTSSTYDINGQVQQLKCGTLNHACCHGLKLEQPPFQCPDKIDLGGGGSGVVGTVVDVVTGGAGKIAEAVIKPLCGVVSGFVSLIFGAARDAILNPLIGTITSGTVDLPGVACTDGSAPSNASDYSVNCTCVEQARQKLAALCTPIKNNSERNECLTCVGALGGSNSAQNSGGIWTAVGCVDFQLSGFIEKNLLGMGIGFGGAVASLCIIYAAFTMQTSRANPEKIKKAQEVLTSCIIGLLLIIFSIFILRLIGYDILMLPGFSK